MATLSPEEIHEALPATPLENITANWPLVEAELQRIGIGSQSSMIGAAAMIGVETETFVPGHEEGSRAYFNRYENSAVLGNTEPGDGYRFRGRGYVQLTGRWNYEHYGKKVGLDLVKDPDLATRPDVAAKIFAQFLKDHGVHKAAAKGEWEKARRGVNPNAPAANVAKYKRLVAELEKAVAKRKQQKRKKPPKDQGGSTPAKRGNGKNGADPGWKTSAPATWSKVLRFEGRVALEQAGLYRTAKGFGNFGGPDHDRWNRRCTVEFALDRVGELAQWRGKGTMTASSEWDNQVHIPHHGDAPDSVGSAQGSGTVEVVLSWTQDSGTWELSAGDVRVTGSKKVMTDEYWERPEEIRYEAIAVDDRAGFGLVDVGARFSPVAEPSLEVSGRATWTEDQSREHVPVDTIRNKLDWRIVPTLLEAPEPPPAEEPENRARAAAKKLLELHEQGKVTFLDYHTSGNGRGDGADALSQIKDLAAGRDARRSDYGGAPGKTTPVAAELLEHMLELAGAHTFRVTELAGGQHGPGSHHYAGQAYDVDQIDGTIVFGMGKEEAAALDAEARKAGATGVLGPHNDEGHRSHFHFTVRPQVPAKAKAVKAKAVKANVAKAKPAKTMKASAATGGRRKETDPPPPPPPPPAPPPQPAAEANPNLLDGAARVRGVPPLPTTRVLVAGGEVFHMAFGCPAVLASTADLEVVHGDDFPALVDPETGLPACEVCVAHFDVERDVVLEYRHDGWELDLWTDRLVVRRTGVMGFLGPRRYCRAVGDIARLSTTEPAALTGECTLVVELLGDQVVEMPLAGRDDADRVFAVIDGWLLGGGAPEW